MNIATRMHNNKVLDVIFIIKDDVTYSLSGSEKPKKIKVRNIIEISISQGYDSILNNLKCCTIFICYLSL